jgi:uncharacterized protein YfkK (UPF0435 family)
LDLSKYADENVDYMFEEMTKKLRMATGNSFKGLRIEQSEYEDLRDLYELVMQKETFSIREIDTITIELGRFRKKS